PRRPDRAERENDLCALLAGPVLLEYRYDRLRGRLPAARVPAPPVHRSTPAREPLAFLRSRAARPHGEWRPVSLLLVRAPSVCATPPLHSVLRLPAFG